MSSTLTASQDAKAFIAKWGPGGPAYALSERAGAQAHFIDLCRLLDVDEPGDPENYCFERGLKRTGAAQGWADVWKRGCFGWEYKAPGARLDAALKQLMQYALPLENPPLLVVSDRLRIEVHTHFTGTPSTCHTFALEDLADPLVRQRLRQIFTNPEAFRPTRTNRQITEEAARTFAETAERLRAAGAPAAQVSHFLTQCLFCFFAEDVGLLPARLFERLVGVAVAPNRLQAQLQALFSTMRDGGLFGVDDVPWFNGGLFRDVDVPLLSAEDVMSLRTASALNWSAIDPSIFGTLFERGLDPAKRSQLGAHYTDPSTIERLIDPVVRRPLLAEWQPCREAIAAALARSKRMGDKAYREALAAFAGFLERLREFRVLDPACGSGNFLYLGLKALKDVEHQAGLEAEALGLQRQIDVTGPHNMMGLEINEYAAELARVTVWIGELQWRIQHGYGFRLDPVLQPLDNIECRDALMNADGTEAAWPAADVVVGNPPFVGDKKMRGELGADYTERLRALYTGRVSGGADLVCYWFEKARAQIDAGTLLRAGLVSTNSIRGGRNREVLDRICATTRIFEAWGDEPWINNGAAVRVSLTSFGHSTQLPKLNGREVPAIGPDLTIPGDDGGTDLTQAVALIENKDTSYSGIQKTGPFDIEGRLARQWLAQPNPNGRPNSDVVRPWFNGLDITRRNRDMWIVDFGADMERDDAMLYEAPFAYAQEHVEPTRVGKREPRTNEYWWLFQWSRPLMRRAVAPLPRAIVTPEVSKHRVFAWLNKAVIADKNLVVIARADDTTFGILHSRFHELWALRLGTSLEDRPRYTPTSTFETFPFPAGLAPRNTAHQRTEALDGGAVIPADLPAAVRPHAEAIARAAHRLHTLREAWLNPPEWTERVPEVVPLGMARSPYPDRIVARAGHEAELAKRTLTNLYNDPPTWLVRAHASLDAAVASAYGWPESVSDLSDDELLRRLLGLNQQRSQVQG